NFDFSYTGIRIERSTGDDMHFMPIATLGPFATSYSDTMVMVPNTYFYRVIATGASGDSAPSNEASVTLALVLPAQPQLYYRFDETGPVTTVDFGNGFGSHSNLTSNGNATFPVTTPVMRLTDGNLGEASSVWYNTRVGVGPFTTTFTLRDQSGPIGSADSVSFVMQAGGTGALGGGGGGGGYAGIGNSFAIKFDLYSGGTHIPTTRPYTGGDNPGMAPRGPSLDPAPPRPTPRP